VPENEQVKDILRQCLQPTESLPTVVKHLEQTPSSSKNNIISAIICKVCVVLEVMPLLNNV